MSNPSQLSVLTTLGINAVKTYKKNKDGIDVEGYGRAKTFTADRIDLDERGAWLRSLRDKVHSFVVLGDVPGWKRGEKKRRMSVSRDEDEATIVDVPRLWMPVDVDQIDFEPLSPITDGEGLALELMDRLGVRGSRCVWHLTNSHGFFDKYRARLWLRLKEPMTCEAMREFAKDRWGEITVEVKGKQKACVDLAVYRPAQPIYTGDPILEGVADPVKRRVGFVDGEPLVVGGATPKAKKKRGAPEDENVAMLDSAGLYIRRLKPGTHCIECPWEDEHTGDSRDDDTFYFEPHFNGHDIPAFKCHHGSCEERKWADVVDKLGVTSTPFHPVDEDDEKIDDWVYIHRLESFWDPRDGDLVTPKAYDSSHGGTRSRKGSPTDRFIADPKKIKADAAEFRPGRKRLLNRQGLRILNTYIDLRKKPEPKVDATPWAEHLEWLIPNVRDRETFSDWLAWCYQRPGEKITWAPILYGPPGTGKTTVFNALSKCIGKAQVSEPTQAELEDKFNDWCFGKLLVKIEELMSGDKYHVAEKLKPIVANESVSIRRMHQTGFRVDNYANVCASTNHMQALPIERGDRRYMLIECRDSEASERVPHMRSLWRWIEQVGYGGIANWLNERDVSKFKPMSEAPMTDLKVVVAEASKTDFERAVDICEMFDRQAIISTGVVCEYLLQNELKLSEHKIGLIAKRRKWLSLGGNERRTRIGTKRFTLWTTQGQELKLRAFLAKSPRERERMHTNMMAKVTFDESDESKND